MVNKEKALASLLEDGAGRDRTTARRVALFHLLLQERCLTREQLVVRVEAKIGKGCFGNSAWVDTFFRDMKAVRQALRAAGYSLAYSRSLERKGYYLRGQAMVSEDLSKTLAGSVAEVDRRQAAVFKRLSPMQRFQLGCSASNLGLQVAAYRLRQQDLPAYACGSAAHGP